MKNRYLLLLFLFLLAFQSCRTHDPVPDFASRLEGDFDIGYLIVDLDSKQAVSAKFGVSKNAKINLKRKSNQYLTATVTIDDSTTKFTDTFDLVVSESADQKEAFGRPGFLTSYKVGAIQGNGINYGDWNTYNDGTIIGFIQVGDDRYIKRFSIGRDFE